MDCILSCIFYRKLLSSFPIAVGLLEKKSQMNKQK